MKDTGKTINGVPLYSDPQAPPKTLYLLNNDLKNEQPERNYGVLTDVSEPEVSKDKPKWYDEWLIEHGTHDSNCLRDITIKVHHSATEQKVFCVRCSADSEISKLVMLLDCALYELTQRDKQ